MDQISELPECIVHHILSFFNTPATLVRMSVLSKNLFALTASFPILDFSICNFISRESFFKYVEYTTSRFCLQNVTAHVLRITASVQTPEEIDIVNKCLELLLKNGVKALMIDILKYRLPDILLSDSVLKSLTISGCELPSSLTVDVVKFKSLILLKLVNVQIDDEGIECLTTSCPLLNKFLIQNCHGFKRFCVYGHQNLRKVWFNYNTQVERIDIEAPNLSTLLVASKYGTRAPQMNLASCEKLTTVRYEGYPLPNSNAFTNFLSNFPFIKKLVLIATTYECKSLKLSSHSLRTLVLHSSCDLDNIEFTTPNLKLFIYTRSYNYLLPCPLLRHPTRLKACMQCYPSIYIDALWFQKLRLFLIKKNGFKALNLYIQPKYNPNFYEFEKLKAIELPPYELKHVELQLDTYEESSAHIAFVDAVLWCCRPRSLTLRSSFPLTDLQDVVKFTYERLLGQEAEGDPNIRIASPFSSEAQKQLRDLKSMSMALPRERNAISFIKKKGKKCASCSVVLAMSR